MFHKLSVSTLDQDAQLTRAGIPDTRILNVIFAISMDVAEGPARDNWNRVLSVIDAREVRELKEPVVWK